MYLDFPNESHINNTKNLIIKMFSYRVLFNQTTLDLWKQDILFRLTSSFSA